MRLLRICLKSDNTFSSIKKVGFVLDYYHSGSGNSCQVSLTKLRSAKGKNEMKNSKSKK